MGLYAKYLFPYLLDWTLGTPEFGKYRQRAAKRSKSALAPA
jgi:hypothetical protein